MLITDQLAILRVPRCGTQHADKALAGSNFLDHEHPVHDGYWALKNPERKSVYAFVREPISWYASLYFYLHKFGHQTMWFEYFHIPLSSDPGEQWHLALKQFTHGPPDRLLADPGRNMSPRHVAANMQDAGIGFWSWYHLYVCGVSPIVDSVDVEIAPIKLLWLDANRASDLQVLATRFDLNYREFNRSHNTSKKPSLDSLYTDELRKHVELRDGAVFQRLMQLPTGP